MPDKYDEAVAFLTENPEHIIEAWQTPSEGTPHEVAAAHCLFLYVSPDGDGAMAPTGRMCGCLTQIRAGAWVTAWTPELTAAIRADKRIPGDALKVLPEHLPVFAEWQRRIDKELNRE